MRLRGDQNKQQQPKYVPQKGQIGEGSSYVLVHADLIASLYDGDLQGGSSGLTQAWGARNRVRAKARKGNKIPIIAHIIRPREYGSLFMVSGFIKEGAEDRWPGEGGIRIRRGLSGGAGCEDVDLTRW